MKTIEANIPQASVAPTIEKPVSLEGEALTVEMVKVYKKGVHRKMIQRGWVYEENFVTESKLHFNVSDGDAARAQTVLTGSVQC